MLETETLEYVLIPTIPSNFPFNGKLFISSTDAKTISQDPRAGLQTILYTISSLQFVQANGM